MIPDLIWNLKAQNLSEVLSFIMESKHSLLCLQELATGPCSMSDESSPHPCTLFEQEIRTQIFLQF
jgi:hypothetical protein